MRRGFEMVGGTKNYDWDPGISVVNDPRITHDNEEANLL